MNEVFVFYLSSKKIREEKEKENIPILFENSFGFFFKLLSNSLAYYAQGLLSNPLISNSQTKLSKLN